MKLYALLLAIAASTAAFADTHVNGYFKSNGTYVAPHIRSDSNHTTTDNYSTQGNTNPYTGAQGTVRQQDYVTINPSTNGQPGTVNPDGKVYKRIFQ